MSDDWLGGWERQINGVAWTVTLIGAWSYLRALNRVVAGVAGKRDAVAL